ncbi:MAG: orotate phosphoribosyltransferase [Candidatus Eisenbacteria bacterium]
MLEETRPSSGIIDLMTKSGALLTGHFELASGLHSEKYIQCALLLEDPSRAERVGCELAAAVKDEIGGIDPSVVVSPALGGVVIGHEVARALGSRSIFTERVSGKMSLRRGFGIETGEKAVVVEDVTTTGGSIREVVEVISKGGGEVVGVGLIVNRAKSLSLGVPLAWLVRAEIENHDPENCPLCKAGVTLVKPGSKRIQMEAR